MSHIFPNLFLQDIIHTRVKTSGIVEVKFQIKVRIVCKGNITSLNNIGNSQLVLSCNTLCYGCDSIMSSSRTFCSGSTTLGGKEATEGSGCTCLTASRRSSSASASQTTAGNRREERTTRCTMPLRSWLLKSIGFLCEFLEFSVVFCLFSI